MNWKSRVVRMKSRVLDVRSVQSPLKRSRDESACDSTIRPFGAELYRAGANDSLLDFVRLDRTIRVS